MNFNGILFVNTVHDSIVLDIKLDIFKELCYTSSMLPNLIQETFADIPSNFKRLFNIDFNLPIRVEITYGLDWGNMQEWKTNA